MACQKEKYDKTEKFSYCGLQAIKSTSDGTVIIDSLFYNENGMLARASQHVGNATPLNFSYVYFGWDSLHIFKENQLEIVIHRNERAEISKVNFVNLGLTTTYDYNTGRDTITVSTTGSTSPTIMSRTFNGNIDYMRTIIEGDTIESYLTYDNYRNVFQDILHTFNLTRSITATNQLTYSQYINGVQQVNTVFDYEYLVTGEVLSKKLAGESFRQDFSYICP